VAQLVEVLRYMPEGGGFGSRWDHWDFICFQTFSSWRLSEAWSLSEWYLRTREYAVAQLVEVLRYMPEGVGSVPAGIIGILFAFRRFPVSLPLKREVYLNGI
jgi:hypothetical protein